MNEPEIRAPDSLLPGDTFRAPDGREYEVVVDGEVLPVLERSEEMLRAESDFMYDMGLPDRACSVVAGQGLSVRFFPDSFSSLRMVRHATHYWHGVRIPCPAKTSPGVLERKDTACPLCELGMRFDCVWEIPVLRLAWLDQDGWHTAREGKGYTPTRLRADGSLLDKIRELIKAHPDIGDWE